MNVGTVFLGPAAIAGLAWLLSFRLWRRKTIRESGHWGGAVAMGAGTITGYVFLLGTPLPIPDDAMDWLPHIALLTTIVGLSQRWWGSKLYTSVPVLFVLSAVVLSLQFRNKIRLDWQGAEIALWLAGLSTAFAISAWNLEQLADRRTGASMPLAMLVWCAAGSVLLMLSGSTLLGQLMGAMAAVFAGAVLLSWWNKGFTLTRGAMSVLAILYGSLLAQGYFYAETPAASAMVAAAAPFALWYGERRKIFYSSPSKAALKRAVYIAVPMSVALALAAFL
jgi:hypothetical protein